MNKLLSIMVLLLFMMETNAQKWKIETGFGYAFIVTPNFGYSDDFTSTDNTSTYSYETTRYGFSDGYTGRLNLLYEIKPGIALNFGGNHVSHGERNIFSETSNTHMTNYYEESKNTFAFSHKITDMNSGLVLRIPINEKIGLSLGSGLTYTIYAKIQQPSDYTNKQGNDTSVTYDYTSYRNVNYKTKPNLGFYTDLGLDWNINSKLQLFVLGSLRARTFNFSSAKIDEYVVNGVDQLPSLTVEQSEVEFVDNYHSTPNSNPNEPDKSLNWARSNGSIAVVLGVRYAFGKSEVANNESSGESGFYFQVGAGYGTIFNPEGSYNSYSTTSTDYEYTAVPYTFGAGKNYSFVTGYKLKKEFSVEIGGMFNKGKSENTFYFTRSNSNFINYEDENILFESSMKRIQTGIRIDQNYGKLGFYLRSGLSVGLGTKLKETYTSYGEYGNVGSTTINNVVEEKEYSGRLSYGGYGAFGILFNVHKNIGIFAETNFVIQSWSPAKSTITKSTYNGVSQLSSLTTAQKETEYVKEFSGDYSTPTDSNQPSKELLISKPFSTAVFTFGLKIDLTKKAE